MDVCHIFISYSWAFGRTHRDLIKLLENRGCFDFVDYSISQEGPIEIDVKPKYKSEIKEEIKELMRECQIVLVIAGAYVNYSDFIQMEIESAKELGKPIIAIKPYGASRTSSFVEEAADTIVNWNVNAIIQAINEYCE